MPGLPQKGLDKLTEALNNMSKWKAEDQLTVRQRHQENQQQNALDYANKAGFKDASNKMSTAITASRAAMGDPTAMAQLAQQKVEEVQQRFASAGRHFGAAISSERGFSAAGQTFRGAGDLAGMLPGGQVMEPVLKFAGALAESVDKLRDWSSSLHNANMKFAEFSGSMSMVQAQQEFRDAMLSRQRGENRAESADKLAEAKSRFETAVTPIDDAWAKIKNDLTAMLLDEVATPIVTTITKIAEKFGINLAKYSNESAKGEEWSDELEKQIVARRPPRMR